MGPGDLADLLRRLACLVPPSAHPDLLVPAEQGADSAVYRVAPDVAIVQSADFFPPMVDDPAAFGRIAAANALSDIYACGARPVTALSLLAVPAEEDRDSIAAMLAAAQGAVHEAGAVMAGGHTLLDPGVKFGLAVTGVVHPSMIVRHNTPRAGDALVLTKPLGSGVLLTAKGRGWTADEDMACGIAVMGMLNKVAAELFTEFHISASTDVTGYGLAGHLLDMLSGGELGAEIEYGALPLLPKVEHWATDGAICGGTKRNMEHYRTSLDLVAAASLRPDGGTAAAATVQQIILCDSQTSGGLLVALPADEAEDYAQRINGAMALHAGEHGLMVWASVIGRVIDGPVGRISVV
jgi:selenide,water dikinase